jgi:serine/threonine protein phosphatase PrpC
LNLVDSISKAGNIVNEDCISFGSTFGLVLDGATGLRKKIIPDSESDAKWFVENMKNCIVSNIDRNISLLEIIEQGIGEMKYKLRSYELGIIEEVDKPSASIAMIRQNKDELEIFSLGDCTILIITVDEKIIRIYDDSVSKLDNEIITKMIQLSKEESISIERTRSLVENDLIKNRYKKNTENGYWILGFDEEALKNSYYKKWNLENIKSVCLFSDGFADFYENMGLADDYIDFYKILSKTDVNEIYFRLRREQEEDCDCNEHPRLKKMDDASILILDIR